MSSRTVSAASASDESDGGSIGETPAQSDFAEDPYDLDDEFEDMYISPDAWENTTDGWATGKFDYNQSQYGDDFDKEPTENLWADYPAETPAPAPVVLCKVHGKLCKKGICREYKRQLREAERMKEAEEKARAEAEKKANRKNKKKTKTTTTEEGKILVCVRDNNVMLMLA